MESKLNSGGAGRFTGRQKSRLYDFNIQQQRLGGRELLTFLSNVSFTRKGKSPVLEALCPCAATLRMAHYTDSASRKFGAPKGRSYSSRRPAKDDGLADPACMW